MRKNTVFSRAPLRISFGGGGSEIPPYVDQYGGAVFSTTISMFATTCISIGKTSDLLAVHSQESEVSHFSKIRNLAIEDILELPKENRIAVACTWYIENSLKIKLPHNLTIWTSSDAPQGSGLGASSVMTVSILKAFDELLSLHLTQTQLAKTAFDIERNILNLSGGLQDQYAAAYGGLNYIEFDKNRTASVMPVDLIPGRKAQLESSLLLIYTGTSRESGEIIEQQQESMKSRPKEIIDDLHVQKEYAKKMLRAVREGNIEKFGALMGESWQIKKTFAPNISNPKIDDLYERAIHLGALGGKISGAGGGGFLLLVVPPSKKYSIFRQMQDSEVIQYPLSLEDNGAISWHA
jgi:D-glycero-alpha-D-manno-heptose-7-phosphate kinase